VGEEHDSPKSSNSNDSNEPIEPVVIEDASTNIERMVTTSPSPSSSSDLGTPGSVSPLHSSSSTTLDGPVSADSSVIDLPPDFFNSYLNELWFGDLSEPFTPSIWTTNNSTPQQVVEDKEENKEESVNSMRMEEQWREFKNFMKSRAPHEVAEQLAVSMDDNRDKLIASIYEKHGKRTPCAKIKEFVDANLKTLKETFERIDVPTIVYEKCGIVHFVNNAFQNLFQFNTPLPSKSQDFLFFTLLSPEGIQFYIQQLMPILYFSSKNALMFTISLRKNASSQIEEYIKGTLCLHIKRNGLGIPILMAASFLPHNITL